MGSSRPTTRFLTCFQYISIRPKFNRRVKLIYIFYHLPQVVVQQLNFIEKSLSSPVSLYNGDSSSAAPGNFPISLFLFLDAWWSCFIEVWFRF